METASPSFCLFHSTILFSIYQNEPNTKLRSNSNIQHQQLLLFIFYNAIKRGGKLLHQQWIKFVECNWKPQRQIFCYHLWSYFFDPDIHSANQTNNLDLLVSPPLSLMFSSYYLSEWYTIHLASSFFALSSTCNCFDANCVAYF